LEGEIARGDGEDNSVQDTNNLQQYKIEPRRKWEERYYAVLNAYKILNYSNNVSLVLTHTYSLMMMG
jgi:hypothetical protein